MRQLPFLLAILCIPWSASGQALSVEKVEPPNWWVGMHWDSLQLMLYGSDLTGITAHFEEPDLRVTGVHVLESPGYAFVDVKIPADLEPGTYHLVVAGGGGSARVPYRILNRETREGRNQGFSNRDVVYLVTPDRFADGDPTNNTVQGLTDEYDRARPGRRHGGDLQGLIDHLDYLADLGVTTLWLNPVLENNGRNSYHGYAATDLYKIDGRLGSNEDYRRFVREAHARGLKVIFDHVNNHIGINHRWMQDLPASSWVNGDARTPSAHYKLAPTDPYADPFTADRLKGFWFVPGMPDLNQRDPFLATYRIQNTLWWLEYTGLDGIREDTYPYPDQDFLTRWEGVVLREYPTLNIVGEIWEDVPGYLAAYQAGSTLPGAVGTNLPSVMDFALMEATRNYIRGEGSLERVYRVIAQDFLYPDPENLLTFLDNHDVTRAIYEAQGDPTRVRQMLALILTSRGIPQLLYGTEIGMMGGRSHVELRADMPGGFPGDGRSVFIAEQRTAEESAMFGFVRSLLHARRDNPALTDGALVHYPPHFDRAEYKFLRITDAQTILVVLSGADEERVVDLSELSWRWPAAVTVRDVLTDERRSLTVADGLTMAPRDVLILEVTY